MEIFHGILVLMLGLILGSFFNVCIFRIPRGESIAYPPSHCQNCKSPVKKYDLIPVISFVLLKGSCRVCKDKISLQYPIVELITGLSFTVLFLKFGISIDFVFYIFLTSVLIITSIIDFNTRDIYEFLSVIGIIGGVGFIVYKYFTGGEVFTYILGAFIIAFILSILAILGAMGWGDVEIAFMCGLYLGFYSSLLMLFISVVFGGIAGIIILISRRKSGKEDKAMAFGPYLALGCFISLTYGEGIIKSLINYYGLY